MQTILIPAMTQAMPKQSSCTSHVSWLRLDSLQWAMILAAFQDQWFL